MPQIWIAPGPRLLPHICMYSRSARRVNIPTVTLCPDNNNERLNSNKRAHCYTMAMADVSVVGRTPEQKTVKGSRHWQPHRLYAICTLNWVCLVRHSAGHTFVNAVFPLLIAAVSDNVVCSGLNDACESVCLVRVDALWCECNVTLWARCFATPP